MNSSFEILLSDLEDELNENLELVEQAAFTVQSDSVLQISVQDDAPSVHVDSEAPKLVDRTSFICVESDID